MVGLEYDDGLGTATQRRALAHARQVVWTRQRRAFKRIRDTIDKRNMIECKSMELPHRLKGWRPQHSALVREQHPTLHALVKQIEQLQAERRAQQFDNTYIPPSTWKSVPLPKDPAEHKAEKLRRAVAAMRALRERRRSERNLDLIGG